MRSLSGLLLLSILAPSSALAATLQVGAGKTYSDPCAAIAAATAGDTIEVDPGTYTVACKVGKTLTVRGVGDARPTLVAPTTIPNGKGIFAVEGTDVDFTAENLEFKDAKVGGNDKNGAGIRAQGRNLTVRGCLFHDNENGILSSSSGEELVETSEFHDNGFGDGQSHNLYMGNGSTKFTFRYNWSHSSHVGHLLKSRAPENWILFNRITDETTSPSDNVDLPNGGKSYLIGNLFEQANGDNGNMVRFAEEGNTHGDQSQIFLVHNTFVNHRDNGTFLFFKKGVTYPTVFANNLFFGQGDLPAGVTSLGNSMRSLGDLATDIADDGSYDYHLKAGAPAIDHGVDVTAYLGGVALEQYVHPLDHAPRTTQGSAPDSGAYEFGDSGAGGSGQSGSGGTSSTGGTDTGGTSAAGTSSTGGTSAAGTSAAGGTSAGTSSAGGSSAGGSSAGGSSAGSTSTGGAPATGGTGGAAGTVAAGGKAGSAGVGGSSGLGGSSTAGKSGAAGLSGSAGAAGLSGAAGTGADTGDKSDDDGGCGCRTAGVASEVPAGWSLGALGVMLAARLRRRSRSSSRRE